MMATKKGNTQRVLRSLMSSPSVLAVGLDPEKGLFHLMVKTKDGEKRFTKKLLPQQEAMFNIVRGLLG
jgi:hypothetical protein